MCHCNLIAFSQSMAVSYELNYKYDPAQNDTKKINYVLDIFSQKSVFRTEMRRTSDSLIGKTGYGLGYNTNAVYELYFSKELDKKSYRKYFVSPLSRDRFFINIMDELKWQILRETLIIGNYKCQKAEVQYAGRHWSAWFTEDISIPEGPYYFHGLPGLIIQIEDDHKDFVFRLTNINKINGDSLYEADGGKEINWEQYKKLLQDYFNDPLSSIKASGRKVVTDNGTGGYQPIDSREFIKNIQKVLLKNNNPIELDHKINYE